MPATSQTGPDKGPSTPPRRVAMLIYAGIAPLDVAGPLEVFGVANFIGREARYDVVTVAPTAEPIASPIGITMMPTMAMDQLQLPIDTLMIAGGGGPEAGATKPIAEWLQHAAPQARRLCSICTGAFALGAAGLLDGKTVTTHWAFVGALQKLHPTANVQIDPIFVRDGDLYTSAGITAGIDLALALVEQDHGREFALNVARFLVLFLKRSGGQAQFSMRLKAQFSKVPAIQQVQTYCLDNLRGDLSVGTLAKRAAMSERNFQRLFRETTDSSLGEFIASARLQAACRLLEETNLRQQEVARQCGFGTAATMQRVFRHRLGVTPGGYQRNFSRAMEGGLLRPASGWAELSDSLAG